jgi:hypothetical protein
LWLYSGISSIGDASLPPVSKMRELWDSGSKYQGFGSNLMAGHAPQDEKSLIIFCPELAVLANPDRE